MSKWWQREASGVQTGKRKPLIQQGKTAQNFPSILPVVVWWVGILGLLVGACQPVSAPPSERGQQSTASVTESVIVPTPTPPPPLPGGPEVAVTTPWPASFAEIPALVAEVQGPRTFDTDAPNVLSQLSEVIRMVEASGWSVVGSREELKGKQDVFVSPVQQNERWAVVAITRDGVLVPVDQDGKVMDRPDWATEEVAGYREITDGLGEGYKRRFELISDHWVPVTRDSEGRAAAFYDVVAQSWRYKEILPEVVIDITKPPSLWELPETLAAESREAIFRAYADGWQVSAEDMRVFDSFLTSQWRLLLKSDGVPQVEKLQNYALLNAIVAYCQKHKIVEATLPFGLHYLVRSDRDNLVPYGVGGGLPQEKETSWYGIGPETFPRLTREWLTKEADRVKGLVNFYGQSIEEPAAPNGSFAGVGDLVLLFPLPGFDATVSQGALMQLVDEEGKVHYLEIILVYEPLPITEKDVCKVWEPHPTNKNWQTAIWRQCSSPETGANLWQLKLAWGQRVGERKKINREVLVAFLTDYPSPHLLWYGAFDPNKFASVWRNGAVVADTLHIKDPEIIKSFTPPK